MYNFLCDEKKEYVISKQVLRSGTSIGANIAEAFYAQNEADFIAKLYISRKEAGETLSWIDLLNNSDL
ncbi:MAG: four helix bundle protein [Paramuribaculum sp.]|nr:four helix bundle protein [Paramuribaculum sp.]